MMAPGALCHSLALSHARPGRSHQNSQQYAPSKQSPLYFGHLQRAWFNSTTPLQFEAPVATLRLCMHGARTVAMTILGTRGKGTSVSRFPFPIFSSLPPLIWLPSRMFCRSFHPLMHYLCSLARGLARSPCTFGVSRCMPAPNVTANVHSHLVLLNAYPPSVSELRATWRS